MKQFSSNEFRVYGGELYVTEDGFRRIFVKANITDIYPTESKMCADIILEHYQDDHGDEMMTIDGTVYVPVFTIMDHVDVELNKHSLMFARMFAKLFDAVGDELLVLESPEDWPYLSSGVARAYFEILKIVGNYLRVAEIWWELRKPTN